MYEVQLLKPAEDALACLDNQVTRRIVNRLNWLAENFNQIRPEALAGDLQGLFKLRVGDYRVIYEPRADEELIVVHFIGHRRDVYRRR